MISFKLYLDIRTSLHDKAMSTRTDGRIFIRQIFYSTTAKNYFGTILIEVSDRSSLYTGWAGGWMWLHFNLHKETGGM